MGHRADSTLMMRSSPVSLSGTTLRFDRSGRRLITLAPDEVTVVDSSAAPALRLDYRARAVACFDDELWIATRDHELVRVDPTGALLGPPVALPFAAHAVLTPAPCGPPAAVWSSDAPAVVAVGRPASGPAVRARCLTRRPLRDPSADAALTCTELEADAVIPITGRRFVVVRGSCLTLPSGLTMALAPGARVRGGCVASDGKSLVLLVARGQARELLVIALGLGQVVLRRPIPAYVAVAVAGGVAAIQDEPRALRVIDLATDRVLGGLRFGDDVTAFAVDPRGRSLAIQSATGELALHRLDPLFARLGPSPAVPDGPCVLIAGRAIAVPDALADAAPADAPIADAAPADAPIADAAPADAPIADAPIESSTVARTDAPVPCDARELHARLLDRLAVHPPLSAPIAPTASPEPARVAPATAGDDALIHRFSAPAGHAADWLCGGDYLHGGA
jgi:hypothetical protein